MPIVSQLTPLTELSSNTKGADKGGLQPPHFFETVDTPGLLLIIEQKEYPISLFDQAHNIEPWL